MRRIYRGTILSTIFYSRIDANELDRRYPAGDRSEHVALTNLLD